MENSQPQSEPAPQPAPAAQPAPAPQAAPAAPPAAKPARRGLKLMPAFWTVTSVISLTVNIILIVILVVLGTQLFNLKQLVEKQLLAGLYENFILMDQAHIKTTIPVSAQVPAKFDLALKTDTVVVLTEDTLLENASVVSLQTGGLAIYNAPATIKLAAGTRLPVALDLSVPVDQMIPVNLMVEVDIPLSQTELHQPFTGLQEVIRPYYLLLNELPNSWERALCSPGADLFCGLVR